jgi:hypothetical protein
MEMQRAVMMVEYPVVQPASFGTCGGGRANRWQRYRLQENPNMVRSCYVLSIMLALLFAAAAARGDEEDLGEKLDELNAQIKRSPDTPMPYYRRAQCLMAMGRCEDGYQAAKEAMTIFVKNDNHLAWMLLESIDLERVQVDVHFNMGPQERNPPKDGIVRPLSFRVWSKGKERSLMAIIDFEIGMSDGKPQTAALGQKFADAHANFGMLPVDAKYEQVGKRAIELIKERYSKP